MISSEIRDIRCPVCNERDKIVGYETRRGVSYNHELVICLTCCAIVNKTDLEKTIGSMDHLAAQSEAAGDFYSGIRIDKEELDSISTSNRGIPEFLIQMCPDLGRNSILDFGAGRGCLASASTWYFERCYATDLNLDLLERCFPHLSNNRRIEIISHHSLLKEQVDAITSFHVLEHIPAMLDVLPDVIAQLRTGGAFLFQVPLLRNDYLVSTHYTFMNEPSVRHLCERLDLSVVGVYFDVDNDFISCLSRKR